MSIIGSAFLQSEEGRELIDRMLRQPAPGVCEICERRRAAYKTKFMAQYVQSTSVALLEEETLTGAELEKRVCEECLIFLQNAKNVTRLTSEHL
jgi:hypothetical protein